MPEELTNLLPYQHRLRLLRDYRFRLGVVAVALLTVLTVTAGVLLIPTYVFLAGNVNAKKAHLASINRTLSSSEDAGLSARLAALSNDARALASLADNQSVSQTVRSVLAASRPGITLSGLTYTPGASGKPSTIAVSGIAVTRDALRGYQLTLQTASFATRAELPVSAYAKDADIAFTIVVTLAP
jgi:hypothetical protein